ncbi:MAG: PH domain-containing protein [Saprospiraceae bacterium]|nr:PH domain-containing protein [Saprospiraceae bacterium]
MFTNTSISPDALPQVEFVEYQPLHGEYRQIMLIRVLVVNALLLIPLIILVAFNGLSLQWIGLSGALYLLLLLLQLGIAYKSFSYKGYAIRQHDLVYTSGWLFRKWTAISFNRIQHCEVSQGVVERIFHLSSLEVFTAGGSASDLKIGGLPEQTAHQIRDFIMTKIAHDEEE